MKVIKGIICVLFFWLLAGCKSYTPAPKNTIKVLAVTHEGDTIQLDVNSLRPRVYQNIYHTYPYYYNYWNPSSYYWGAANYYYVRPRPQVNVSTPQVTIPNNKPTGTYNKPANVGTGPSLSPSLARPSSNSSTNSNKKIN